MAHRKRDPREAVDRMTQRLLNQNDRALAAWDKHDPSAGEGKRAVRLTPEQARKRAIEVAKRHERNG